MTLLEPTEAELREIGSLKWTAAQTDKGLPTMGAGVAEMDFGTAPEIATRMKRAIDQGLLGYQPAWVTESLCEATTFFQGRRFGWVVEPSWVRVAASVLSALNATIESLTRPGSAVVVPTPAYMPFLTIPHKWQRECIEVPSRRESGKWTLDLEGIRAGLEAGAGLVILCNPWNPTGRFFTVEELRAVHDLVADYDALVFSDEIHSPLVPADASRFTSYASLGPSYAAHTITAVAASKGWNIAGLPSAQIIIPDNELRRRWDSEAAESTQGAVTIGMLGAITAYRSDDSWLEEVLGYISGNLDLLDQALAGTAVDYQRPESTYLTWWGFENYDLADEPATLLRNQAGINAGAGVALGKEYRQWVRVNAAMARPAWERTLDQTRQWIDTLTLR